MKKFMLLLIVISLCSCGTQKSMSTMPYYTANGTWYCGKGTALKYKHPPKKTWVCNSKSLKHKKFRR